MVGAPDSCQDVGPGQRPTARSDEHLEQARLLRSQVDPATVAQQLAALQIELDAIVDGQARQPAAGRATGHETQAPCELIDADQRQGLVDPGGLAPPAARRHRWSTSRR